MSRKLYASFDIEADGSCPAKNSMLSIGIVFFNGAGKEVRTYQRNIKPLPGKEQEKRCMVEFWAKHPDVWAFVTSNQVDAKVFVDELAAILADLTKDGSQVTWVAHPAAYDWQWLKNYYDTF